MVTRTWIGGGNNQASNPQDWSPTGLPIMADNLYMTSGTMNIVGYQLPSNTYLGIQNPGSVTLNLSHDAAFAVEVYDDEAAGPAPPAIINIDGSDTLELGSDYESSTTVDLAANSQWIGNFDVNYAGASITINGPASAKFINTAVANTLIGGPSGGFGIQTINVAVTGSGIFTEDESGVLTFSKAVGAGQKVNMFSSAGPYPPPILNLNAPKDFYGTVDLINGEIDLNGLAKADSYSFNNDMLSIYSNKRVIDTLSLQATTGQFAVEKTATGVSIYTPSDTNHMAGTLLPLHV